MNFEQSKFQKSAEAMGTVELSTSDEMKENSILADGTGGSLGTPDYMLDNRVVKGGEGLLMGLSPAGVFAGGLLLGGIKLEGKALMKLEGLISEKLIGLSGSGEKDFERGYKFARRYG